jgi:hypothetical protein
VEAAFTIYLQNAHVSLKQKPVMICFRSSVFSKEGLPRVSGHHRRHLVLVMLLDLDVLLLVSLHRSIRHRDQTQDKCSFTSLVLMVMTATTPFSKHLEKFALSWGRDKSKRTSGRAATTAPKITLLFLKISLSSSTRRGLVHHILRFSIT